MMISYFNRLAHFILLLGLVAGLVACKPNPQNDIALFQPFITENINKKSDDPYISSTVKPGDKIYNILTNIQHGDMKSAYEKLMILVDREDYEAQFWVAKMIYQASVQSISRAIKLYELSAQQGNPYAYYELSPQGKGCLAYFGKKTCTEENFNKAIEGFKKLAKQGDLRAQYFLLKQQKLDQSKKTRAQYIQEVIRFAQGHYYQPLMDYVNTILIRPQGKDKYEAQTPEQYQLATQLLTIAANHNYIPAIRKLASLLKNGVNEDRSKLLHASLKLGSTGTVTHKYLTSKVGSEEKYFYNALYKSLSGKYIFDSHTLNEDEKTKVNEKVKLFMKNITPMVYIDGFTSRDDWVD